MQLHTKILIGMAVGLVLGLVVGPNSPVLPHDGALVYDSAAAMQSPESPVPAPLSQGLDRAVVLQERGDWVELEWTLSRQELVRMQADGQPNTDALQPGVKARGWVPNQEDVLQRYSTIGQLLVDSTEWMGRLFLALIKMVVVPLVFLSLVVGIASLGDLRALGRLGLRTMAFFGASTLIALTIGVTATNVVRPGAWLAEADRERLLRNFAGAAADKVSSAAEAPAFIDQLIGVVPQNPIAALASGNMLQIITFATLLGVALTFLGKDRASPVVDVFDRLNDAMVMLVHIAMVLAPFGVAALLFKVAGTTGPSVLVALLAYSLVVIAGLLLHLAITYGLAVTFLARLNFFRFLVGLKEALLVAFSTSSSSATLPVTKECVEREMNVSPKVASFVLPLGATVNMDGTALYQGVAAIFIAQIYGIELDFIQQATVIGTATLASVGAAGVPGAGMITLVMVLTAVGVPTEGLALVLGVDRVLDMFRTMVNVTGDASATAVVARLEGEDLHFNGPKQAT